MTRPSFTERTEISELVAAAVNGEATAWDVLIRRYQPLITSVTRAFRLSHQDGEDASQAVWLKLLEHLGDLRTAAALPGWIVTTTQRVTLEMLRRRTRTVWTDSIESSLDLSALAESVPVDAELLRNEAIMAVRDGLSELRTEQQEFLKLVVAEPPVSYRVVGMTLRMPVGSIGPSRARCLKKLQSTSAIQAYQAALAV